jgi:hypothetical protein
MAALRISLVAALTLTAAPALADDPRDPTMQTPEAVAHDREMIRRLNEDMLAQVTARDAGYAKGWKDHRLMAEGRHPQQLAYERDRERYEADRAAYEQQMADWREDVRACRAGYYGRC